MPKELEKAYEPKKYEDEIYKRWEESGFFNPDVCVEKGVTSEDAQSFSIVLPPPNVTGTLHMGHAAMLAIEDVMIRYARMQGKKTLWLPGTDHAAVATESKVEGILIKEQGMKKPKEELGRDAFLDRVKQFAQESHDTIVNQSKKMGSSLDWSREAYTLDDVRNKAVRSVFKKMYDDGLIYRGYRVVNWSVKGQSTCSDDELVYVERASKLYTFKYNKNFPISIATTRPETKVGDTAVAVHPEGRWKQYIGQSFEVKDIGQKGHTRIIKIIGDVGIDESYGTGALGVTTAHSPIDFEMYLREKALGNDIGLVQVIGEDGLMTKNAGSEYVGLSVDQAREKFVQYLRDNNLLEKEEDIMQNVGTSDRFKDPVEPLPKTQWFIDVNKEFVLPYSQIQGIEAGTSVTLKKLMQSVVHNKQIEIVPDRFNKTYFHWIDNLRDWCISRQIWFGHQIPVWYKQVAQPTRVYYLVHSTTLDNEQKKMSGHANPPLSELGGQQAMALKEQLKDLDVDIVLASDLERATDTARIVFGDKDVDIIYDARLRECNYGDFNGRPKSEKPFDDAYYIRNAYPNGESYLDVEKRVVECLAEMQTRFAGKKIAIVGHCGPQHVLNVLTTGQSWQQVIENDWRKTGSWKPYWEYDFTRLTYCNESAPKAEGWVQDNDTLDTWFSSGLWTFSTLLDKEIRDGESLEDWLKRSKDFHTYHPTSVLETGYDILFFWVARMILMTTYTLGDVPFKTVYLHGLVRDEQGRKMSKSLGNIIDPLDMIEKYGTDATRLSLLLGSTPGNDMKLSEEKIAGFRNFTNKLWNISRFMLLNIPEPKKDITLPEPKTLADRWILWKLNQVIFDTNNDFAKHSFSSVGERLRDFTWGELADWYLEIAKVEGDKSHILNYILNTILKLWHPFMPFVTETIWEEVYGQESMLMVEQYPYENDSPGAVDDDLVFFANTLQRIITQIRAVRTEYKIEPAKKINAIFSTSNKRLVEENKSIFIRLANLGDFNINGEKPVGSVSFVENGVEVYLDFSGAIDTEKEKARIEKEIASVEPYVKSLSGKLAGDFAKNAPSAIVEKEKEKLIEAEEKLSKLKEQMKAL